VGLLGGMRLQRPLLFTYRRCPYAMRARMALLQAGIAFDAQEISLRDKPSEMLRLSPKGTVPVLLLPDQHVIDQSVEIMAWAFHGRDPDGWWDRAQTDLCQELVGLNDGPFKQHLDGYKYPERVTLRPQPEVDRDAAVACLLQPLDRLLSSQKFVGGSEPCAADLAIFPFVRQFRAVDVE
jgi:glutathione S-transferase